MKNTKLVMKSPRTACGLFRVASLASKRKLEASFVRLMREKVEKGIPKREVAARMLLHTVADADLVSELGMQTETWVKKLVQMLPVIWFNYGDVTVIAFTRDAQERPCKVVCARGADGHWLFWVYRLGERINSAGTVLVCHDLSP